MGHYDLEGEKGKIFFHNDTLCLAVITDPELAAIEGGVVRDGKCTVAFPVEDLFEWMVKLRVNSTGNGGIAGGDWPDGESDEIDFSEFDGSADIDDDE